MNVAKLNFITQNFIFNSEVLNINTINSGLINETYIVEYLYDGKKSQFILQSLSNIFDSHEIVNSNHKLITEHMNKKLNEGFWSFDLNRWEVPNLIRCQSNKRFLFPYDSNNWRAMIYIDRTFSQDYLEDESMAYQTGIGLAKFHLTCSDFDCSKLKNSINNFHNTKYYMDQYISSIKDSNFSKSDNNNIRVQYLVDSLYKHIGFVDNLLKDLGKKSIHYNVIHGDPKLNNFLFDVQAKYVVSLIDLDTVSSGYLLTDIADCIRSISNLAGEDPIHKENVYFDINSCIYFLKGYFSIIDVQMDDNFKLLPEYIYLIIFELTIRFLTDFLKSNTYFKIKYETHNLFKAEIQYRLLSSFLMQLSNFSKDLKEMGISSDSPFVSDVQKFV